MVERIKTKYRVAFFPYKADMWDSLESIWEEFSKDERFESAVVVIPYFQQTDKMENGSIIMMLIDFQRMCQLYHLKNIV